MQLPVVAYIQTCSNRLFLNQLRRVIVIIIYAQYRQDMQLFYLWNVGSIYYYFLNTSHIRKGKGRRDMALIFIRLYHMHNKSVIMLGTVHGRLHMYVLNKNAPFTERDGGIWRTSLCRHTRPHLSVICSPSGPWVPNVFPRVISVLFSGSLMCSPINVPV